MQTYSAKEFGKVLDYTESLEGEEDESGPHSLICPFASLRTLTETEREQVLAALAAYPDDGVAGYMPNGNLVVVSAEMQPATWEKLMQEVRRLLARHPKAQEEEFYGIYDFSGARDEFYLMCQEAELNGELMENGTTEERIDALIAQGRFDLTQKQRGERWEPLLMLVEDDHFVSVVFLDQLRIYETRRAGNAVDCFKTYLSDAPDILFLDIELPDWDGISIIKKIRSFDPDAFIVMLSANSYAEKVKQAMEAGANGFMTKPFNRGKIEEYLKKYKRAKGRIH